MRLPLRWRHGGGSGRAAERVEVLRYDPRRRRVMYIITGAASLLALLLSVWIGRQSVLGDGAGASLGALEAELRARSDEVRILEQQVANLQAAADIGSAATAQLRSTLSETQATVERLSREGELYRSLMDSSVRTRGLTLHRFEVRRGVKPGTFAYKLTLLQRAQKHVQLTGKLSLTVKGVRGDKPASVDLPVRSLDMLYFQTLEGDFQLPEGFQARTVRVTAEAGKGRPQKLDSTQDWKLEEG